MILLLKYNTVLVKLNCLQKFTSSNEFTNLSPKNTMLLVKMKLSTNETCCSIKITNFNNFFFFLFAFSIPLDIAASTQAEAQVLLFGIQQRVSRGYDSFYVQLDSLLLVNILLNKYSCP